MLAKAVAHHTTAAFIRVVGSEFVQKYLGEVCVIMTRTTPSLSTLRCLACSDQGTQAAGLVVRCCPSITRDRQGLYLRSCALGAALSEDPL